MTTTTKELIEKITNEICFGGNITSKKVKLVLEKHLQELPQQECNHEYKQIIISKCIKCGKYGKER